jgi:hypothetical protein
VPPPSALTVSMGTMASGVYFRLVGDDVAWFSVALSGHSKAGGCIFIGQGGNMQQRPLRGGTYELTACISYLLPTGVRKYGQSLKHKDPQII